MSLRADQKALLFLGAIALLGAGVRVVRAASGRGVAGGQPALERQLAASDSARLQQARKRVGGAGRGRGRRGSEAGPNREGSAGRNDASAVAGSVARTRDRVAGRLDLDVASAAQIDSLPGITPTIAKRIVADRMIHGPFVNSTGLRRVSGVGAKLLSRIDTLVVFSGVVAQPSVSDTILPRAKRSRSRRPGGE